MDTRTFTCPTCNRLMTQYDEVFSCAEHGEWLLYGTSLLVHRPSTETLRREAVTLPWEHRLPSGLVARVA